MGNQIEVRPKIGNLVEDRFYKTKISRSQHIEGDPLLDCNVYTPENSYNECLQNEIQELFAKELGCRPPLFTEDPSSMCNHRFNVSESKSREVRQLLAGFFYHERKSRCKFPCTKNIYTTKFQFRFMSHDNLTNLGIRFDTALDVTQSTFAINEQTLLTKLGGNISMGRTVLWILVSLLGATQVISHCQLPEQLYSYPF